MRYTIFDPEGPAAKGYSYTPNQIEYIVGELNNNSNLFVFLDCPDKHLDRLVGRMHNSQLEDDGTITGDLVYMKTPMGIICEQLELSKVDLKIAICGEGDIRDGIIENYEINCLNVHI